MQFNSVEFATFFSVVFLLYLVVSHEWQNRLLLAASYLFYAAWDWRFLSLILISTAVDYTCAIRIHASQGRRRRLFLIASMVTNLGILSLFKYFNFFSDSLIGFLGLFGLHATPCTLNIILPVGISFYTFQTMGYTIDVYRRRMEPQRRFGVFALFVAFFPQLVAGPIERASRLLPQITTRRHVTSEKLGRGAFLILYGLFQKIVVADNLAPVVDQVFGGPVPGNALHILLAVYAFAVQIFCDFAGYSNIARGVAACLGFDLMVNFHSPYFAVNPVEFWKRWHISLSSWLRDYLYIPLGGNRGGTLLTLRNLALTMLLGGLWHGARWTFVLWGAYHGLLLVAHRLYVQLTSGLSDERSARLRHVWTACKWAVFFHLVCLGWIFFRAQSTAEAWNMLGGLMCHQTWVFDEQAKGVLLKLAPYVCLLLTIHFFRREKTTLKELEVLAGFDRDTARAIFEGIARREPDTHNDIVSMLRWPVFIRVALYLALFYSIVIFGACDAQTFIYFQF